MKRKLQVACIGTGYFSQFHFDAWKRCPEVQVVGVCDCDITKAERAATELGVPAYNDAAEMLDRTNADILDIITPPDTHLPLIRLAAEKGVNVICQKPFCGDLKSAQQAVAIGEAADIDITVHENFRFQPWYRCLKKHLEQGKIGDIYQVTFRLRPGDGQGEQAYLERQPYFQTMPRFLVHETAIHLVDVFRFLLGELSSVSAELSRLNPAIAGEDACLITLNFANGTRGLIDGNRLADHPTDNTRRTMGEMLVEGSNGVIELTGGGKLFFRSIGEIAKTELPFEWHDRGFGGDCVYNFTRHIVDHYADGKERMNSARAYLTNLEIEEAIYQSSETGTRIDFIH